MIWKRPRFRFDPTNAPVNSDNCSRLSEVLSCATSHGTERRTPGTRICFKRLGKSGHYRSMRKRASIGRVFAQVIVFLLLSGIVCGEFPELLALTDNTTNDFTIRKINSLISPHVRKASRRVRAADVGELNITAHDILFQHLHPFERAPFSSEALILGTVLRT
jgi:hypothetical protein